MQTRKATCTPPCKRPQSHADLKHTVDELKAENKKLKLTIDELGLDELKAESDKREHTAIQELEQRVHRLMARIEELTATSQELDSPAPAATRAENAELKGESAELKDESNGLKRESEKLKGESEQLKAESAELKDENNKLKRESEKLKGEQEKSKRAIDELNSKLVYAQDDNCRLKNKGLITQVHELVYGPGGQPDLRARSRHRQPTRADASVQATPIMTDGCNDPPGVWPTWKLSECLGRG